MKTQTWLPLFPGFYNTIFECDSEEMEIEYINEARAERSLPPVDYNDIEWDYTAYNDDVARCCCEAVEDECDMISKIEFESLRSPRFYNYSNDAIYCEITFDKNKVYKYVNAYTWGFQSYLKERYTSRSGFISHYSNNINEWMGTKEMFFECLADSHKCGAIFEFICINDGMDEMCLYNYCNECYVAINNYNELVPEMEG